MTQYEENFKQMIVELNQTGRFEEYRKNMAYLKQRFTNYLPNHSKGLTRRETTELRKENARLKEELEILKKPQLYSLERPKFTCSIYKKIDVSITLFLCSVDY